MKQAIAGVTPAETQETTVMTAWPSVAKYGFARTLGGFYSIRFPDVAFFRLGNFIALATIPFALALYFLRIAPRKSILIQKPTRDEDVDEGKLLTVTPANGASYRLTNRRLVELRNELRFRIGLSKRGFWIPKIDFIFEQEVKSIHLDRFDSIEVEVLPGQAWYHAGDLVFRDGGTETFRLSGVSRPETFRATCMKSHMAYVGVKKAKERELAHA